MQEQALSKLDLLLAGTEDAVLMIEGFADFLTEEQVIEALETGHAAITTICHAIGDWAKKIGKEKNRDILKKTAPATLKAVEDEATPLLQAAIRIKRKEENVKKR